MTNTKWFENLNHSNTGNGLKASKVSNKETSEKVTTGWRGKGSPEVTPFFFNPENNKGTQRLRDTYKRSNETETKNQIH